MINFRNLIQTNDCSVEFIFKKKLKNSSSTDKMQHVPTPKDFAQKTKSNRALTLGADPGVPDIFTADNSAFLSSKERIRKTSTKEYYYMYGFNLVAQENM